jgi:hypothetical protein
MGSKRSVTATTHRDNAMPEGIEQIHIRDVARYTGKSTDTLCAWLRRHKAVLLNDPEDKREQRHEKRAENWGLENV